MLLIKNNVIIKVIELLYERNFPMNEGNINVASGHGYSVKFSSSVKKSSKKLG